MGRGMSKYRLIYYDLETTGLPRHEDRRSNGLFNEESFFNVHIIELAAYDPKTGESFNELVKPPSSIPADATAVHHISNEMVASAPDYSVIGQGFIDWLGEHTESDEVLVLVAHNGNGFDNPLLMAQCKKYGLQMPVFKSLDSLTVIRGLVPKTGIIKEVALPRKHRFKLTTLAGALMPESELSSLSAHRALDDVKMLARVFEIITEGFPCRDLIRSYGRTYGRVRYAHAEVSCQLVQMPPITRPPLAGSACVGEVSMGERTAKEVTQREHFESSLEGPSSKKPRLEAKNSVEDMVSVPTYLGLPSSSSLNPFT